MSKPNGTSKSPSNTSKDTQGKNSTSGATNSQSQQDFKSWKNPDWGDIVAVNFKTRTTRVVRIDQGPPHEGSIRVHDEYDAYLGEADRINITLDSVSHDYRVTIDMADGAIWCGIITGFIYECSGPAVEEVSGSG